MMFDHAELGTISVATYFEHAYKITCVCRVCVRACTVCVRVCAMCCAHECRVPCLCAVCCVPI